MEQAEDTNLSSRPNLEPKSIEHNLVYCGIIVKKQTDIFILVILQFEVSYLVLHM